MMNPATPRGTTGKAENRKTAMSIRKESFRGKEGGERDDDSLRAVERKLTLTPLGGRSKRAGSFGSVRSREGKGNGSGRTEHGEEKEVGG